MKIERLNIIDKTIASEANTTYECCNLENCTFTGTLTDLVFVKSNLDKCDFSDAEYSNIAFHFSNVRNSDIDESKVTLDHSSISYDEDNADEDVEEIVTEEIDEEVK